MRHITISSPAHPSNRRNLMTAHCLSLTSIIIFRFSPFRNAHKNPPWRVIISGMRSLNALHMKCLGMNWVEFHPMRCGQFPLIRRDPSTISKDFSRVYHDKQLNVFVSIKTVDCQLTTTVKQYQQAVSLDPSLLTVESRVTLFINHVFP
jgi:hypothetical protein